MIIQKKKQEPIKFQPVTIEITLDTQEEVDMLKDLCNYNISIPHAISEIPGVSRQQVELLKDMIYNIRQCLLKPPESPTRPRKARNKWRVAPWF